MQKDRDATIALAALPPPLLTAKQDDMTTTHSTAVQTFTRDGSCYRAAARLRVEAAPCRTLPVQASVDCNLAVCKTEIPWDRGSMG